MLNKIKSNLICWEEATIKDREQDRVKRQIRESIWIRKQGQHSVNRDGGNYILPNIYDQLLMRRSPSTDKSRRTDRKFGHYQIKEVLRCNMKL